MHALLCIETTSVLRIRELTLLLVPNQGFRCVRTGNANGGVSWGFRNRSIVFVTIIEITYQFCDLDVISLVWLRHVMAVGTTSHVMLFLICRMRRPEFISLTDDMYTKNVIF